MAARVISLRVPEDLLAWATDYAKTRGVSRTDLLIEGLRSFKVDCEGGVPDVPEEPPARVPWQAGSVARLAPAAGRQQRVNEMIERARKSR